MTARLAGGLIWFSAIELIVHQSSGVQRWIIPVNQWAEAIALLPENLAERAALLYERLITPRTALTLGDRTVRLDQPQVMGILNLTPDSFSDGGQNDTDPVSAAVAMAAAGAAIIDIGGESTRPKAELVWEGDEIKRIEAPIRQISPTGTALSIDTRKAAVMAAAIASGARMVNDISALLYDDQSLEIVKAADVPVVLMHAPSQSSDPHKNGAYCDVVKEVYDWLEARVDDVVAAGIPRHKILIDPGLGFGKSLSENLALINNVALFHAIGCAVVFGASRKRMIGALSNEASVDARLGGSVFLAMKAVEQGAQIVRVHDVAETVQAIHVWRGMRDAALTAKI